MSNHDVLLRNLRTIGTHHCDGTVGEEAADEIEALQRENERLRNGGCARNQRTTQFCATAEDYRKDAERIDWIIDNCKQMGGGQGFTVFIPVDTEDLRDGIDRAREAT